MKPGENEARNMILDGLNTLAKTKRITKEQLDHNIRMLDDLFSDEELKHPTKVK